MSHAIISNDSFANEPVQFVGCDRLSSKLNILDCTMLIRFIWSDSQPHPVQDLAGTSKDLRIQGPATGTQTIFPRLAEKETCTANACHVCVAANALVTSCMVNHGPAGCVTITSDMPTYLLCHGIARGFGSATWAIKDTSTIMSSSHHKLL